MSALNPIDIVGKSKLVALGSSSTCTVTTNNHVYCWGSTGTNSYTGWGNNIGTHQMIWALTCYQFQ